MSVVPIEKKLTEQQLEDLAAASNIDHFALKAFCEVEGGGIGFSDVTGRIVIQFEPEYFKRNFDEWRQHEGLWTNNGISNQTKEWAAFLDAMNIDKEAAMLSTSIGVLQVMGFNHIRCNFRSVEEMWAFNEISEANQLETGVRFIMSDPILFQALRNKKWATVAERYNGKGFRALAVKNNSTPYDIRMANAYAKFSNGMNTHETTATVNLRTGNGTQYPVIEVLRTKTAVSLKNKANGWGAVKVVATGAEGWISLKYIS